MDSAFLVEALDARWTKYCTTLQACRQAFSEESVHDVRVSTRRLLALLDLLRALPNSPPLKSLRRAFKAQLDDYDDLRDTQVMLLKVSEALAEVPELAAYEAYLKQRETKLLQRAAKQVETLEPSTESQQIQSTNSSQRLTGLAQRIETLRHFLLTPSEAEALHQTLFQAIDETYAAVLRRYGKVDASHPATIHRLRVAFKKLRYSLEILKPLLPDAPAHLFKDMHAYQTSMGDIQDLEVLLAALADFAKRRASYDPGPARRYFQRRHAQALYTYLEGMQQIHTFWRPAPEAPFPWAVSLRKRKQPSQHKEPQQSAAPVPAETDQTKGETP